MKFKNFVSNHLRPASIGVLNQAITSGTNFLLGIYFLSHFGLSEFGKYGILFASAMVVGGLLTSLVTSQTIILLPEINESETANFIASSFHLILIFGAFLILTSTLLKTPAKFFLEEIGLSEYSASIFVALGVAYASKDFFARLAYSLRVEIIALKVNTCVTATIAFIVLAKYFLGESISAEELILYYASGCSLASIAGYASLKISHKLNLRMIYTRIFDFLPGGKWMIANDLMYSARTQAHIFITAAVSGPVAIGLINAAKIFVTPALLVTPSLSQLLISRLVPHRLSRPTKLIQLGLIFSAANLFFVVLYGLAILLLYPHILPLISSTRNLELFDLILAWIALAGIAAVRYGLEATNKALKNFRSLTSANAAATIAACVLIYSLLRTFGPTGSVYGFAIAELILTASLAFITANKYRNLAQTRTEHAQ